MSEIFTDTFAYNAEVGALVSLRGSADLFTPPTSTVRVGDSDEVVPWGDDNNLPLVIMNKIGASEVVSSNLFFNASASYGLGIKPYLREVDEAGNTTYKECTNPEVLEFFENNDIDGYFLEQINDMVTFFNVFPEIIVSQDGNKIVSLRHLEATFSRWGSIGKEEREITRHFYCADWEKPTPDTVTKTAVLSRYNTCEALKAAVLGGDRRFVLQVSLPTPGRTYYSLPWWWSIFRSGWYDLSAMIPIFKKALLKNHLAVRYMIYVSDEYWERCAKQANITRDNAVAYEAMKQAQATRIIDFLKNEDGKGGGLVTTKLSTTGMNKAIEEKLIEVVPIKPEIEGGEFIQDAEEASNIISYAMGVHPSLNGATPGKTSGSLGGSDKRELYMIKQAMLRPLRERLLRPLLLIKKYNAWPENLVFGLPEFQFPTLDVAKSGAVETNQNPK